MAVSRYFEKYRVVALGLASIGNNAGLIIYAQLIMYLEHTYGWRGLMLIGGALTFHLCVFASVMMPLNHLSKDSEGVAIDRGHRKLINCSIFRKVTFVCFCVSNLFFNIGYGIYSLHLPNYSMTAGFVDTDIGTMWLTHGTSNIIGKVFFSFLGQHPAVNPTLLYTVSIALGGVTIGITPNIFNRVGILTSTGVCGFAVCVTGALIQSVIYDIVGYERFADGTGMSLPFKAAGNLIGGPLAG